jgi:hypothetical protein
MRLEAGVGPEAVGSIEAPSSPYSPARTSLRTRYCRPRSLRGARGAGCLPPRRPSAARLRWSVGGGVTACRSLCPHSGFGTTEARLPVNGVAPLCVMGVKGMLCPSPNPVRDFRSSWSCRSAAPRDHENGRSGRSSQAGSLIFMAVSATEWKTGITPRQSPKQAGPAVARGEARLGCHLAPPPAIQVERDDAILLEVPQPVQGDVPPMAVGDEIVPGIRGCFARESRMKPFNASPARCRAA